MIKRSTNLHWIISLAIMTLFIISSINAEILLSQTKSIYNLGEEMNMGITLDSLKQGYLDLDLNCNGKIQNLYHNVPDSVNFAIKRQLAPPYISDLMGNCFISAKYDIDTKNSENFLISNKISLNLNTNNMTYTAGENVTLAGEAIKENNIAENGFIEAKIENIYLNLSAAGSITNGKFSLILTIPQTLKSGNYALTIQAYDKDEQGNILNIGTLTESLTIKQKPAKLDIALDKQTIEPGENIEIIPFLYDYAGDVFPGEVLMKIEDSGGNSLFEGYKKANEKFTFKTENNFIPGIGKIILQKDSLNDEKQFDIKVLKKISTNIDNQTLIVINTGNVIYNGIIQIMIGNESLLKELNLEIGSNKTFEISAPDGLYDVVIKDDSNVYTQGSFSLTGNVISVREMGEKISNIFIHYPIVWFFVVIIVLLFLWVIYKKYETHRRFNFSPSDIERKKNIDIIQKKGGVEIVNPEKMQSRIDSIILQGDIRKAEQVLSLHGNNNQAGIIAIKIKGDVNGIAKENVRKALEYAYRLKGVSYQAGDFIILIFSPLLTRTNKNEENTIKAAIDIDNYLAEHNRKFRRDLINYGIGINSGEIINKLERGVLQFASMGKTISLAKRIAEVSNQEILLSKEVHEKTLNSIKVEKKPIANMDVFTIKRVIDVEKSQKFINDFMRRS